MENYFGGLVEFESRDEFDKFIDNIDVKNSIMLLETSITYALKAGAFDLSEAYILYKCLSKIKENGDKIQS